MSELKVNKISPRSGTDVALGDSGDTITVPAGASIVNNGTSTGFGPTGAVTWDTTAKTANFTAVSKVGYFVDTTSSAITVTLPATPSAGDIVGLVDYAGTFDTNALTIDPNGEDIEGDTINLQLTGEREGVVLVYVDSTQGWLPISGINEGTDALSPIPPYTADFLVIAGGAGGASARGGGGGAGGYRNSYSTETSGGGGSSETSLTFNVGTTYTITVGAGGASNTNGSDSSISGSGITTITSTGGGTGGNNANNGFVGGSGGGGGGTAGRTGASGTANQGRAGGNGENYSGGGGGGADTAGSNGTYAVGGNGGNGLSSSITGSSIARGGGGGGSAYAGTTYGGTGGLGGGATGTGTSGGTPSPATANTGGGGGGTQTATGGNGGSGVVILRMPTADYSGTTTGSPTVSTSGSDTILIFNSSGTYTG